MSPAATPRSRRSPICGGQPRSARFLRPARSTACRIPRFNELNQAIRQRYVEHWNLGIQRQLDSGSAIEVRDVGNLSLHQWLSYNLNEYNHADQRIHDAVRRGAK